MDVSTKLQVSRVLILVGAVIALKSVWMTFLHVGDPTYLLVDDFTKGSTHAWFHSFREVGLSLAVIVSMLAIFFAGDVWRTKQTWYICLILMVGYYAPSWVGSPFIAELAPPHMKAKIVHINMLVFPMAALFIGKETFVQKG